MRDYYVRCACRCYDAAGVRERQKMPQRAGAAPAKVPRLRCLMMLRAAPPYDARAKAAALMMFISQSVRAVIEPPDAMPARRCAAGCGACASIRKDDIFTACRRAFASSAATCRVPMLDGAFDDAAMRAPPMHDDADARKMRFARTARHAADADELRAVRQRATPRDYASR